MSDEGGIRKAWQFREKLRRFLRRLTNDREETEELVQETYLRYLALDRKTQSGIQNVESYLMRIARNLVIDTAARRQSARAAEGLEGAALEVCDDRTDPERSAAATQLIEKLTAVIDAFPEQRRKVFAMKRFENCSRREIATRLNIAESTVNTHLWLAAVALAEACWEET